MRDLAPCGTRSAAKRHRRNGERLDPACAAAYNAYQRAGRIRSGHVTEIVVPVSVMQALAALHAKTFDVLSQGLGPEVALAIVRAPRHRT